MPEDSMKDGKRIAAGLASAVGAMAGVAAIRTYQKYNAELAVRKQMLLSGSQVVDTPAGKVEYAVRGEGRTVLVVHGSGGGYDQAAMILQHIGGIFKAICVSRFGYLRTPLPENASPEAQADAFAALLDMLEIPEVIVFGLSGGGPSSIQFAARHPERCQAVVLLSAVSQRIPPKDLAPFKFFDWTLNYGITDWLAVSLLRPILFARIGITPKVWINLPEYEKAWIIRLLKSLPPLKYRSAGMFNDYRQITSLADLPFQQVNTPTLVIHTADDPLVPVSHAQLSASRIPNARLVQLPKGGHTIVGNHHTVIRFVMRFLEEQLG